MNATQVQIGDIWEFTYGRDKKVAYLVIGRSGNGKSAWKLLNLLDKSTDAWDDTATMTTIEKWRRLG